MKSPYLTGLSFEKDFLIINAIEEFTKKKIDVTT